LKVAELWESIGGPPGVVNMITGDDAGALISTHPGIDKIAFTGSTHTGRKIIEASSGNMKRLTLECGGKSPLVVMNDADLTKAAGAAYGFGFWNSGQFCMSPSRIFVQSGVHDQFVEMLHQMTQG
jgi:aldehyde dehydrogenase (NAD+)